MKNNILTQKAMAYVLASLIIVSTSLIYCASPDDERIVLAVDIAEEQLCLLELLEAIDIEKFKHIEEKLSQCVQDLEIIRKEQDRIKRNQAEEEQLAFNQWLKSVNKSEQDIAQELLTFDQWQETINKNEQNIEPNLDLTNEMLKKSSTDPLLSDAAYSKRTRSNSDLDAPSPKKTRSNEFENLDELENNDPERWKGFWPA